jgi:hypothetical protein
MNAKAFNLRGKCNVSNSIKAGITLNDVPNIAAIHVAVLEEDEEVRLDSI